MQGAPANLNHKVGRGTIANVLKRNGIEPAPERGARTKWSTFLKAHWKIFGASDFFSVEVWTPRGLIRPSLSPRTQSPGSRQQIDSRKPNRSGERCEHSLSCATRRRAELLLSQSGVIQSSGNLDITRPPDYTVNRHHPPRVRPSFTNRMARGLARLGYPPRRQRRAHSGRRTRSPRPYPRPTRAAT